MSDLRLGLAVADRDLPDDSGIRIAEAVDASGIDSLWTNETGGADAAVTLGAWAAVTERVTLATGVIPLAARSTATLALATRQLHTLTGGRLLLGIGVGQRAAAEKLHRREWIPPLAWTRTGVEALHEACADVKVVVGALGPKMLALAAETADGALLNWVTAEHAREMRSRFDAAAGAAGRRAEDVVLAGYVRVAAGPGADDALAGQIGFYSGLPFYRELWEQMGNPDPHDIALASDDGRDLAERMQAWDALDVVVARIVPTPEFGLDRMVDVLCETVPS